MHIFKNRSRNDDGMTLIELVVGMFVMGLVSIMIFNVFQHTNETSRSVSTDTYNLAAVNLASPRISKEIRNAASFEIAEDGQSFTSTNFADETTTWKMTDEGLDNGSYVHDAIKEADFGFENGMITVHLKAGKTDVNIEVAPRVKPQGGVVDTGAGITAGTWTSEGDDGTLTIH